MVIIESLGDMVDKYKAARENRLLEQKIIAKMLAEENQLKLDIIKYLKDGNISACGGKLAIAKLVVTNEPTCENMDALYLHILATGEFELLYRRINPASIKERWDRGVSVPGITFYPVESLSISKIN